MDNDRTFVGMFVVMLLVWLAFIVFVEFVAVKVLMHFGIL